MDCCCAQLDNPPLTQTAKHQQLIPTCVTAATLAIKQQQNKQCALMHYQQQATRNTSSETKIAQSRNCCCAQLDNPPSTWTAKHLQLISTCVTAATQPTVNLDSKTSAAYLYLCNCSNTRSGVAVTDVLLQRTVRLSSDNTTAEQAM
eukprot:5100981-Ditylum_brightwellii.AAC.1